MRNRPFKTLSFRTLLCLLLLVVLVPTLLIQAYLYHDRYRSRRSREFQANLEIAAAAGQAFQAFVLSVVQQEMAIATAVSANPPLEARDLNRLLVQSAAGWSAVRDYSVTDPSGQVTASSDAEKVGLNLSLLSCFARLAGGGEWVVSDVGALGLSGDPFFRISRAIVDAEGAFLGMISATIATDQLDRVLPVTRSGGAGISLLDSRGMLAYRYPHRPVEWGQRDWRTHFPALQGALQGREITATLQAGTPAGNCLFGVVPVPSLGWAASACRPEAVALRPIYSSLLRQFSLFSMVALAAFLAALALARPTAAAVDRLRSQAQALGRGEEPQVQTPWAPSEIKELAAAFSRMAELVQRREQELRESEEHFRTVVDNLTEGLFIHIPSGRIVYQNLSAIRMHGYQGHWPGFTREQAAALWQITDREGRSVPFDKWVFHRVLAGEAITDEVVRVRHREGRADFWASYRGVPIFGTDGRVKYALITMRDESARIQAEEELRRVNRRLEQIVLERTAMLAKTIEALRQANQQIDARAKQLAALAGELTMAEQRERRRLSQILHDGLQQHLAAAKMQLGLLMIRLGPKEPGLAAIEKTLSEAVRMSRSLSADLSPPALFEGGLTAGFHWLARRMRERHSFLVHLQIQEHPELPEDVKILVFESVRELLFNAFKHSRRLEARVELRLTAGCAIEICVKDHGVGFAPEQMQAAGESGGGFGLFSIRERLNLIGGRLTIESAPGKGCCFTLNLPCGAPPPTMIALPELPPGAEMEPPGPFIRVLLADDHTLFRDGIARLLGKEPDIAVVGEARNGREAVELCRKLQPQVILMDINMPVLNGIEATRLIHRESPAVRIIGLSMHEEETRAREMLQAGASGYKTKTCPAAELVEAVRG